MLTDFELWLLTFELYATGQWVLLLAPIGFFGLLCYVGWLAWDALNWRRT